MLVFDPLSLVTFFEEEEEGGGGGGVASSPLTVVVALVPLVVGPVLIGATVSAVGGSKGMVALVTLLASIDLVEAVSDLPRVMKQRKDGNGENMSEI